MNEETLLKQAYDRGFMDGITSARATEVAQRQHEANQLGNREKHNTPWPDHGAHNSKLAPPGPNKINGGRGASLSMPTPATKVEGV